MNQNASQNLSFLLEIGTEDLPARFLPPALQQLKEKTMTVLNEHQVSFADLKTYGTPRRLAVIADGIPHMQEDRIKEVFGPSKKVAFDENGNPTKAALGFAQSQKVSVERLAIKSKDRGEYVVAVIEEKGVQVKEILPEILKRVVLSLNFPKSMRWGDGSIRFARPVRWIMALFNGDVIRFDIDGITSSNLTRGHRFLSPAAFQIKEIMGYKRLLANNYVLVDYEERKKLITDRMENLLSPAAEKTVEDEELLETVSNLVEYPVPVIASFSKEYLNLPKELLITVMKGHQKYFAVQKQDGMITNRFIVISNTSEDNADIVRIGAERVIKARFEDARFYFEEDARRPLADRIDDLRKVTFQESLGSLYDKTDRVVSVAGFLAGKLIPSLKDKLVRAARLAKTDLITGVVREFPELQGIMGKYYALHDGEEREVAEAIEEHYQPAHSGGKLPQSDAGSLLSIADKTDNIAAFFSVGLIPTGSEDPFALRRQALGIIAILFDKGYDITLKELVNKALENLTDLKNPNEITGKILQFFEGRLETVLSDCGYAPDLIQSILPQSTHMQLSQITERLDAVKVLKEQMEFNEFLTAVKRVNNIIPKTSVPQVKAELLTEEPELMLKEKLDSVRTGLTGLMRDRKYPAALNLLATLIGPINHFFDTVLVMDKREEIKLNRLSLLNEVWKTVSAITDFSKLTTVQ